MSISSFSIAVTGAGGSGAVTTGLILLESMAQHGFYGFMTRSSGPQIRGGESAVMMRFDTHQIGSTNNEFNFLLAMDWFNIERFIDEIPLDQNSLVIYDLAAGDIPNKLIESQAKFIGFYFKKITKSIKGGRANMMALGVISEILSLSQDKIETALNKTLGRKGKEIVSASLNCVEKGREEKLNITNWPENINIYNDLLEKRTANNNGEIERWSITGNEACGLGALKAGVRFVAAYPITPATEILEWLSPRLEKLGGGLLQAEDELASINMIIGSSFGGVASLTATSGPGLSLMMEGIGLAIASETPLVIINVGRGGPSTGIPTKSEQSDLNIALYGCHGDAPHLVLAPLDIADAIFTTYWASTLAEQLQTVAIVLSDQFIGQSRAIIDKPQIASHQAQRLNLPEQQLTKDSRDYFRYELTESGISPMSIPGSQGGMYTADGLEHNSKGTPSSISDDHIAQLEKRKNKLLQFDYGEHWAEIIGNTQNDVNDLVLITWGSSSAMVKEAKIQLDKNKKFNLTIKVISIRLLMPLPTELLISALKQAKKVIIIEQNQGQQLFHYLHSLQALPIDAHAYSRAGPLPLRPNEIIQQIEAIL